MLVLSVLLLLLLLILLFYFYFYLASGSSQPLTSFTTADRQGHLGPRPVAQTISSALTSYSAAIENDRNPSVYTSHSASKIPATSVDDYEKPWVKTVIKERPPIKQYFTRSAVQRKRPMRNIRHSPVKQSKESIQQQLDHFVETPSLTSEPAQFVERVPRDEEILSLPGHIRREMQIGMSPQSPVKRRIYPSPMACRRATRDEMLPIHEIPGPSRLVNMPQMEMDGSDVGDSVSQRTRSRRQQRRFSGEMNPRRDYDEEFFSD